MLSKQIGTERTKPDLSETQRALIEKSIKLAKRAKRDWEFFRSRPTKNKLSF